MKIGKFFLLFMPLCFFSCPVEDDGGGEPMIFGFRFSVKNETSSVLTVKLVPCVIPSMNARFEELSLIPDEVYKLLNPNRYAELGTECTINPSKNDFVYNHLPIRGLGVEQQMSNHPNIVEIKEKMLDKLVSFTLTISRGNKIIYRAVGWDVPEDDRETYHIDDKMWGVFNTAEENYHDSDGNMYKYPLLTSKLFPDGNESGFIYSLIYFIRATPTNIFPQEMAVSNLHISDDDYWK